MSGEQRAVSDEQSVGNELEEILPILIFEHGLGELAHALFGDPSLTISNALETSDLETLPFLEHFYISRSLRE